VPAMARCSRFAARNARCGSTCSSSASTSFGVSRDSFIVTGFGGCPSAFSKSMKGASHHDSAVAAIFA